MFAKSLWEKASEYGSKAKGYLKGENETKRSVEVEEVDKAYSEKFNVLKKEIETFQKDTISDYENKLKILENKVEELYKDNEILKNSNNSIKTDNHKLKDEIKQNLELNEKIQLLESKLIENENEKNKLNSDIANMKQIQLKENFLFNLDKLRSEIELFDNKKIFINEIEIKNLLQTLTDKIGSSFLNKDEDNFEFNEVKEQSIKNLNLLSEKIEEEIKNFKNESSNSIIQIKLEFEENLKKIENKLSEYSNENEIILTTNNKLTNEINILKEENCKKDKNNLEMQTKLEKTLEVANKLENYLNQKIKDVKSSEAKLKENVCELEKEISIKNEKISNLEENIKLSEKGIIESNNQIEELNGENRKLKSQHTKISQTFKQFFLLLLEDDIFIDTIEETFKNMHSDLFFEEIYKLSNLIKPTIIFKIHHSLLSNDSLLNHLGKFNLDTNIESQIKNYIELSSINQIKKMVPNDNEDQTASDCDFIQKLLIELCSYIENLNNSISKQSKSINELNIQLKRTKETLDESKKNDTEKYDLLNKHITKLQQDCREYVKTEKIFKDTIESLESTIKELKSDNEKISYKLKSLNSLYDELIKEKNSYTEKISGLIQQSEIFKIENTELNDKNNISSVEIQNLKNKIELLNKEKSELFNKISEFEKLKSTLQEKIDIISRRDTEINQLKNSFMDLEEFIVSLKAEKEHNTEMHNKQIFELSNEFNALKETIRSYEEMKLTEVPTEKVEAMEKIITDLEIENKHLKDQKDKMKKYSEEILLKVKNDLKDTEFMIDKRMITNILFKYFEASTNDKLKFALLDTLANFMGYSNDERRRLGLHQNSNNTQVKSTENDKLNQLSNELYDFILNA